MHRGCAARAVEDAARRGETLVLPTREVCAREKLCHVRRASGGLGERRHAHRPERQPQEALVLIHGGRLIAAFSLRAHVVSGDPNAAVLGVSWVRFVETYDT